VTEQDHAARNVEPAVRWVAVGRMQAHWQHRACPGSAARWPAASARGPRCSRCRQSPAAAPCMA